MNKDDNYLKDEIYELFKKDNSIFDFIQDGSLDGIWYWDLEKPENEWMSPKFWTTLGYNPDEMPHSPSAWQNIINQEDLKVAIEMVGEHLKDSKNIYDQIVRYKHKNGSTVWIRCRGMAIRDNNGKPIRMIGAHQDITLQKKAEEDILFKSKIFEKLNQYAIEISVLPFDDLFPFIARKIKQLFEVEEVVINLFDEKKSEIVTKYTTFSDIDNNKISKFLGGKLIGLRTPLSKENLETITSKAVSKVDSLHDITFGNISDVIGKIIEKIYGLGWFLGIALMQNKKLEGTIVLVGKKDKEVPDPTILETFIKITTTELSRKISELATIESESRYRSLLTNLETGVVVHNKDTSIVLSNERASELLGLSKDQMKGKVAIDPHWKFIYEDNTEIPLNEYPVMKVLNSKKAIKNQIFGVRRENNSIVWLIVNGFPNIENGEVSEIVISFNDITEVRLANQALLKAKQEAEESEQRFKALHNASFGGIVIHDKGMILDCNQGLSEMTGYSLEELIGMNGLLLIAPQDRDFVLNQIAIAYEKPYEAMGLRKNGEQFPMRLEARNIPYKGKQVRTVEFRDLTEQKKAEEELQIKNKAIESSINAIAIADLTGKLTYVNSSFLKLWHYEDRKDVLGFSTVDFWNFPDEPKLVMDSLNSNGFWKGEMLAKRSDNSTFIAEVSASMIQDNNGLPIYLQASFIDITENKKAEEALRKSEAIKNAMVSNIGDVIVIIDANGINKYKSPNVKKLFGWKPDELIGKSAFDLVHTDSLEFVKDYFFKILNEPFSTGTIELQYRRKDGEYVWIEINLANLLHDKDIQGILGNYHDISERKFAEEKIRQKDMEFRKLSQNLPDLIFQFTRRPDGSYCVPIASEGIKNIFACNPEDVIDDFTPIAKVIHPDDADRVIKDIENSAKNLTFFTCEFRVQIPGKPIQWIFSRSTPEKLPDGSITWFGFNANITDKKEAENELLLSKEKAEKNEQIFKSLIESAPDGVAIIDINGNMQYASPNAVRHFGYEEFDYIGRSGSEFTHPEDTPLIMKTFESIMIDPSLKPKIQYRFRRKDGEYRWIETTFTNLLSNKYINGFILNFSDITERKNAEILIQDKSEEIAAQNEELNLANQELLTVIARAEQNEANVTAIIEGTQHSIWAFDKNYDILYINQVFQKEFYQSFGVKLEIGINLINCLPAPLRPFWMPRYDRVLAGEQYTVEDAIETEFGTVYIQVTFNPIIKNGEVIGGSCFGSNITERKQAEKELLKAKEKAEESEMQFRNLFENASDAIFIAEEETGIIIDVNHAAEKLMMMQKEELIGLHQSKLHPPEVDDFSKDSFKKHSRKLSNDRTPMFIENDVIRKDGTKVPVEVLANKLMYKGKQCLVGTFRDITERRHAEMEILRAKEKIERHALELNKVQTITHVGSWYLDLKTNDVRWTDELYKMYGFDPNLPPPPYSEHKKLFVPESWELLSASLNKTRETGIPYELELKTIRKDNSNGWMWVRGDALFDNNNNIIGLWGAAQDITERKHIEEQLRLAKEQAEESDRLKSAFLANMSHEIRTPMNGILGFAQLLKEPDLSGDEQIEFISIIEKSGKRMLNIINDIIDISKIEAGLMKLNIQESNINDQIEYIYSFFQPEAHYKNISLSFKIGLPNDIAFICTDREKVFAIFTNLVKNAIKFTDKGSIEFGYNLIYEKQSKSLQFYVKDTGVGIPKSRQMAIFERFIQADITDSKAYQGAGLGLAITKAYIEMLGGRIWVESEEGLGSTFYFTLPYRTDLNCEAISNNEKENDASFNNKKLKILIAEDDKISETLMEKLLNLHSSEILKASTGKDAVEICRNTSDIDIVLMDIQMPEINGYEATRKIREFNKDIIIIAQTAYGLTGDKEKALEAGCNDYLSKPIAKEELIRLLNKYKRT